MRCKDCKFYRPLQPSKRGALKGSCKKKSYVHWVDFRYGMTKACKTYFESKKAEVSE